MTRRIALSATDGTIVIEQCFAEVFNTNQNVHNLGYPVKT